jgi:hypothetical protein
VPAHRLAPGIERAAVGALHADGERGAGVGIEARLEEVAQTVAAQFVEGGVGVVRLDAGADQGRQPALGREGGDIGPGPGPASRVMQWPAARSTRLASRVRYSAC